MISQYFIQKKKPTYEGSETVKLRQKTLNRFCTKNVNDRYLHDFSFKLDRDCLVALQTSK